MTKTLLTGIATLFLATGAAYATERYYVQCGSRIVYVFGHQGYTFTEIINGKEGRKLSARPFRFDGDSVLHFRGHKCFCIPWEEEGVDKCPGKARD